jgi:hypothetical protein
VLGSSLRISILLSIWHTWVTHRPLGYLEARLLLASCDSYCMYIQYMYMVLSYRRSAVFDDIEWDLLDQAELKVWQVIEYMKLYVQ